MEYIQNGWKNKRENQIYAIKIGNAEINLKILYEDNHIIVVEKPVNIPSQGDKTGDIDMLLIGDEKVDTPLLQVPHPRMKEREFVLLPLKEILTDFE